MQAIAEKWPGKLYVHGLRQMERQADPTSAAEGATNVPPAAARYVNTVVNKDMPLAKKRELKTLALAMDHVAKGEVAVAADVLMQRFKAVEAAASSDWQVASQMELISETTGISTYAERKAASKKADQEVTLKAKLSKANRPPQPKWGRE